MQPDISILIDHRAKSSTLERVLYSIYKQQVCSVCEVIILCSGNADNAKEYCRKFSNHSMITFAVRDISYNDDLLDISNTSSGKMLIYLSDKLIMDSNCINDLCHALRVDTFVAPEIIPDTELPVPSWVSQKTLQQAMPLIPIFATFRGNISSIGKDSIIQLPYAVAYCYIPAKDLTLWAILKRAYKRGKNRNRETLFKCPMTASDFYSAIGKILYHVLFKSRSATRVNLLRRYCESLGCFLQSGSTL